MWIFITPFLHQLKGIWIKLCDTTPPIFICTYEFAGCLRCSPNMLSQYPVLPHKNLSMQLNVVRHANINYRKSIIFSFRVFVVKTSAVISQITVKHKYIRMTSKWPYCHTFSILIYFLLYIYMPSLVLDATYLVFDLSLYMYNQRMISIH